MAVAALSWCFIGFTRAVKEPPVVTYFVALRKNERENWDHLARVIRFPQSGHMESVSYALTTGNGCRLQRTFLQSKPRGVQDLPD